MYNFIFFSVSEVNFIVESYFKVSYMAAFALKQIFYKTPRGGQDRFLFFLLPWYNKFKFLFQKKKIVVLFTKIPFRRIFVAKLLCTKPFMWKPQFANRFLIHFTVKNYVLEVLKHFWNSNILVFLIITTNYNSECIILYFSQFLKGTSLPKVTLKSLIWPLLH